MPNEKDKEYYQYERLEMFYFMPNSLKKTIEFGCSNGYFSATIKENFGAEVWGVDMDSSAISKAEEVLDKAVWGQAMQVLEGLPNNYFDCVICNDFLEHLENPTEFLTALKPHVSKSAFLVCSLPNVRYWKNIRELLFNKDWRYREGGILDNTHLRFFTKKSMKRLLGVSGLTVDIIKGINPSKSILFGLLNILTLGFHNDMKYYQFGIRAKFNN